MKQICLGFLLITSTVSYGQYFVEDFIGNWKYHSTTDTSGLHILPSITSFNLTLNTDSTFTMKDSLIYVAGTWTILDDILVLDGLKKGSEKRKIQKLRIHLVSDNECSFKFSTEMEMYALLHLRKKN